MKVKVTGFKHKNQNQYLFDNLSASFEHKKLNVIVGLNGAGKTTLLDIITGVLKTESYRPEFKEKDIVYQLQGINVPLFLKGKDIVRLILKSDSVLSFHSIMENFYSKMAKREEELINKLWDRKIGEMSLGERRWLAIRSVAQLNRKLYIFDEPTAGIDPYTRKFIFDSFNELVNNEDKIVIITTHLLHELENIDCNLLFLHEGEMLYQGNYNSFLKMNKTEDPDMAFQKFIEKQREVNYSRNDSSKLTKHSN